MNTTPATPDPGKSPAEQRHLDDVLDAHRDANREQPDNFKDDALTDKVVSVEPDGTGPSSTGTLDTEREREKGSGSPAPQPELPT